MFTNIINQNMQRLSPTRFTPRRFLHFQRTLAKMADIFLNFLVVAITAFALLIIAARLVKVGEKNSSVTKHLYLQQQYQFD